MEVLMERGLMITLTFGLMLCLSAAPSHRPRRGIHDCSYDEFWNDDLSKCVSCAICKNQSKTPGCVKCPQECGDGKFWNFDTQQCISCTICETQPNTPQCHVCYETTHSPPVLRTGSGMPAWIWALVALVLVAVPLAAVLAWIKSKEYQPSEVAKPVQEIGIADEPELRNLTSE